MWMPLAEAGLQVAEQGLRFLNEKQRTKYQEEYRELLQEKVDYENEVYPDYTDADVDLLRQRIQVFLQSFAGELKRAHVESMRQEEG